MASILLVDDNDMVRGSLCQILVHAGYTVHEANNGETALEVYRRKPCDLVITDIEMPRKNGLEFITELWQESPHAKVIAISGSGSSIEPQLSLQFAQVYGALHTFTKPIPPRELLDKVQECLA